MSKLPQYIKDGWRPHGPSRCRCPRCGASVSTNALARSRHECPPLPRLDGEFSVWQWFANGESERVRLNVDAKEAVEAARHYCNSVGARMGLTTRVIIVDDDDNCNFEWIFGRGVTFK